MTLSLQALVHVNNHTLATGQSSTTVHSTCTWTREFPEKGSAVAFIQTMFVSSLQYVALICRPSWRTNKQFDGTFIA